MNFGLFRNLDSNKVLVITRFPRCNDFRRDSRGEYAQAVFSSGCSTYMCVVGKRQDEMCEFVGFRSPGTGNGDRAAETLSPKNDCVSTQSRGEEQTFITSYDV